MCYITSRLVFHTFVDLSEELVELKGYNSAGFRMADAGSEHGVCTVRVINYRRPSYQGSNIKIAPKQVSLTELVRFVQHDTDVTWTLRLVRISEFYICYLLVKHLLIFQREIFLIIISGNDFQM